MPRYIFEVTNPDGSREYLGAGWYSDESHVIETADTDRKHYQPGSRIRAWLAPRQETDAPIDIDDMAGVPVVDYTVR